MNHILVINAGSSSVKFSVYQTLNNKIKKIISARAVKLFHTDAELTIFSEDKSLVRQQLLSDVTVGIPKHKTAVEYFIGWLSQQTELNLVAVGHRVVHGGPKYAKPVLLTDEVMQDLEAYKSLAPLHQPHNLAPIRIIQAIYPNLPHVACFDTAFHQTQAKNAASFGLPERYFEQGIRRYGFHGLSYEYIVACLMQERSQQKNQLGKIVIAHLGNGASMCAIENAKSVATTMSFTPLDGLIMGTRSGSLDPGVVMHLQTELGLTMEQVSNLLYKEAGLLGISKETNNMRKLLASDKESCKQAVEMFCYQVNRHLGMLVAELGGLDELIFTAGIGENAPEIRQQICKLASWLGIQINQQANQANSQTIHADQSRVKVSVMPTDEAVMIAKHTQNLCM